MKITEELPSASEGKVSVKACMECGDLSHIKTCLLVSVRYEELGDMS